MYHIYINKYLLYRLPRGNFIFKIHNTVFIQFKIYYDVIVMYNLNAYITYFVSI